MPGIRQTSAGRVTVRWDQAAVDAWSRDGLQPRAALDIAAAMVVQEMKRLAPVSPVVTAYANPLPAGTSTRGGTTRRRFGGDLPLRPSGYLRNSVSAFRLPDGSIIIGPTAPYGRYVNNGTQPHEITSHGPWPLRNRGTGQVFGRHVHHPGTRATHFVERSAEVLRGARIHV
jgi:hypothetical protein